jgi:hypothetical protein
VDNWWDWFWPAAFFLRLLGLGLVEVGFLAGGIYWILFEPGW